MQHWVYSPSITTGMTLNTALTKRVACQQIFGLLTYFYRNFEGTPRRSTISSLYERNFHILFAQLQLHLTVHLLSSSAATYDVYFVDQPSTCVPFLQLLGHTRLVFYCHFPASDKLLANGAFVEGNLVKGKTNFLKWLYRQPMAGTG
jgi:hypothetical protein